MLRRFVSLLTTGVRFVYKIGAQNAIALGSTIIKPLFNYSMGCISSTTSTTSTTSQTKAITNTTTHVRKPIPHKLRNSVWVRYHGTHNTGSCYCCGTSINRYNSGWHCSHVIADSREGTSTIDNLRSCCSHCNLSMGDQNLYAYIQAKELKGPGAKNVNEYFRRYPEQRGDKRTVNYGRKAIVTKIDK